MHQRLSSHTNKRIKEGKKEFVLGYHKHGWKSNSPAIIDVSQTCIISHICVKILWWLIHCCAIGKNEFDSNKKKRGKKQLPAAATVVVDYRRGGVAMKQCIHGTQVFDVIPPSMAGSTSWHVDLQWRRHHHL